MQQKGSIPLWTANILGAHVPRQWRGRFAPSLWWVRFPLLPQNNINGALVQTARIVGLHPADKGSIPLRSTILKGMTKIDKKKRKLQERIDTLQEELRLSLTKKDSATAEVSVGDYQRKIQQAREQLAKL